MGRFLSFRNGNKTDEHGLLRYFTKATSGDVVSGLTVAQQSSPNMSIKVSSGDLLIRDTNYAYEAWNDADYTITIATADPTNPRIDLIVAYVDKSLVDSTNSNSPDGLKIVVVPGTPNASPTVPSSGTITTQIGASNPYTVLAQVRVNAGATSIVSASITDKRVMMKSGIPASDLWISANEDWTYNAWNATTREGIFSVPSDATTKYTKGYRGKITQTTGGVKHFIITDITATTIYAFFETGKTFNNEPVLTPQYSPINAFGFPYNPDSWTLELSDNTNPIQSSPVINTQYNLGGLTLLSPRGVWNVYAKCIMGCQASTGTSSPFCNLSTSNSATSDLSLTARDYSAVGGGTTNYRLFEYTAHKVMTFVTNTNLYINGFTDAAASSIQWFGGNGRTIIRAVCAYL